MCKPYPEFVVGGVYRFDSIEAGKEYGDWTVVRIDAVTGGERVYASCTNGRYKNPCSCMVDTRGVQPSVTVGYTVTRIDDDPVEPEDWS